MEKGKEQMEAAKLKGIFLGNFVGPWERSRIGLALSGLGIRFGNRVETGKLSLAVLSRNLTWQTVFHNQRL